MHQEVGIQHLKQLILPTCKRGKFALVHNSGIFQSKIEQTHLFLSLW